MAIYGNARGTFTNMEDLGFSIFDYIRELIDNQLDAGAKHIYNFLHSKNTKEVDSVNRFVFVDDAQGMSKEQLVESVMINNRKHAIDNKNGYFGVGFLAALNGLTIGPGKATILSKTNNGRINQMILDFNEIKKSNNYPTPIVHEVTISMNELWTKYAINKKHGTVIILECSDSVVAEITRNLPNEKLGETYNDYINEGIKINITTSDETNYLIACDVSDKSNATHYKEHEISVWKKILDGIELFVLEFKDDTNKAIYVKKFYTKNKYSTLELEDILKQGYIKVGTLKYTCSIRFSSDVTKTKDNWKGGGFWFKRGKKLICKLANPEFYSTNNAGDHHKRPIKSGARFVCTFDTSLDKLISVETNKSRLNKNKINQLLFVTLEYFADKFCTETRDVIYPKPKPLPLDDDIQKCIKMASDYLKQLKTIKRSENLTQDMREICKLQGASLNINP